MIEFMPSELNKKQSMESVLIGGSGVIVCALALAYGLSTQGAWPYATIFAVAYLMLTRRLLSFYRPRRYRFTLLGSKLECFDGDRLLASVEDLRQARMTVLGPFGESYPTISQKGLQILLVQRDDQRIKIVPSAQWELATILIGKRNEMPVLKRQ